MSSGEQPQSAGDASSRVEKLNSAFAKTLAKVVQTFTFETFLACFPLLCATQRNAVDVLHPIYTTLVSRFIENTQQEFDVIVSERRVRAKLGALDRATAVVPLVDAASSSAHDKDESNDNNNNEDDVTPPHSPRTTVRKQAIARKRALKADLELELRQLEAIQDEQQTRLAAAYNRVADRVEQVMALGKAMENAGNVVNEWRNSDLRAQLENELLNVAKEAEASTATSSKEATSTKSTSSSTTVAAAAAAAAAIIDNSATTTKDASATTDEKEQTTN